MKQYCKDIFDNRIHLTVACLISALVLMTSWLSPGLVITTLIAASLGACLAFGVPAAYSFYKEYSLFGVIDFSRIQMDYEMKPDDVPPTETEGSVEAKE